MSWPMMMDGSTSFNPHPPEKVGATWAALTQAVHHPVSILTHPKRWVLPGGPGRAAGSSGPFQSSPTRKGGCYPTPARRRQCSSGVSILTHPKRWVLPDRYGDRYCRHCGFNPHPPEKVGATAAPRSPISYMAAFQSSPTRKGGCYVQPVGVDGVAGHVSILTHPKRWVLRGQRRCRVDGQPVSILTHPKRWVLRAWPLTPTPGLLRFNPHPPEKVGATGDGVPLPHQSARFNPHPPEKVGATRPLLPIWLPYSSFNPHPPEKVGATWCRCTRCKQSVPFQSSPTRKGGCYLATAVLAIANSYLGFNPHPPEKVGATSGNPINDVVYQKVSILTHPKRWVLPPAIPLPVTTWETFQSSPTRKGGCYGRRPQAGDGEMTVSILTHPKRWVLPHLRQRRQSTATGFNPHPPEKVGATRRERPALPVRFVSILTHPKRWVLRTCRRECRHTASSFNPHPPEKVGATRGAGRAAQAHHLVSILTHPKRWVLRHPNPTCAAR